MNVKIESAKTTAATTRMMPTLTSMLSPRRDGTEDGGPGVTTGSIVKAGTTDAMINAGDENGGFEIRPRSVAVILVVKEPQRY